MLISKVLIKEDNSESIIWNLHVAFPIALVCRDNNILDVYHLVHKVAGFRCSGLSQIRPQQGYKAGYI